ncbi:anaerobic ribonucleoside-triphosphate reductase activating protein [Paracoccus jiaweipingae]|uniref:anaerobic ribonucleoside-triphosphate reductase activating protein n=1 Tax=unclassified Paracoccus (in: a-proteobacteria) TaxID=2688777 RepID=UPI0037A83F44
MADIRIGGLERLSLCDWPGQMAAVLFLQGCPWDCGYCHNPDLIPATTPARVAWADVLAFLRGRVGLLDAVVFSGGEPLLQRALPAAMAQVRDMGFAVGLHTGGAYPDRLARVLGLVDWVGFDVKAAFDDYPAITATPGSGARARDSLRMLLAAGVACDIRTTLHPAWLPPPALARLHTDLAAMGCTTRLQPFRPQGCRPDRLPVTAGIGEGGGGKSGDGPSGNRDNTETGQDPARA